MGAGMNYADFLRAKVQAFPATGLSVIPPMPDYLFPHQAALASWALRRGRCAVFADTGLGKMLIELVWSDAIATATNRPIIILAPLAVAPQIVAEAERFGIAGVMHARQQSEAGRITVTNYERLHRFDPSAFGGVVLDESSCIKNHTSKTLQTLIDAFAETPFKLPASATPAPNDWTELGTHAEFLGVCTRQEMLAEFFVHDGAETQIWRLKGHAREAFWRWVSTWGAMVRRPSDLGFDDSRYVLPPLHIEQHTVDSTAEASEGRLFALEASTLSERRDMRRASQSQRITACIEEVEKVWGARLSMAGQNFDQRRLPNKKHGEQPTGIASTLSGASDTRETRSGGNTKQTKPKSGPMDRGEILTSEGASAFLLTNTTPCFRVNEEDARSAGPLQPTEQDAGLRSTIATEPAACAGSYASPAISPSPNSRMTRALRVGPQNTLSAVLIWCDYNSEQDALERHFGDLAFSVRGSMQLEEKEDAIRGWMRRERPVMISKPSIMGWGINAQHCSNMMFVGIGDSFEMFYQAVRRVWRFGQQHPVHIHVFASHLEGAVVANLKRKEADAREMAESLAAETRAAVVESVIGTSRETNPYNARKAVKAPAWLQSEAA